MHVIGPRRPQQSERAAKQGVARGTLFSVANELRVIAGRLNIADDKPIANEQIRIADGWAAYFGRPAAKVIPRRPAPAAV
jgi:hypothetical protein